MIDLFSEKTVFTDDVGTAHATKTEAVISTLHRRAKNALIDVINIGMSGIGNHTDTGTAGDWAAEFLHEVGEASIPPSTIARLVTANDAVHRWHTYIRTGGFPPNVAEQRERMIDRLQDNTGAWMARTFPLSVIRNKKERGLRLLEEALELAQASGVSKQQVDTLVQRTYSRPIGAVPQEAAQVFITLAALCNAHSVDLGDEVQVELDRIEDPVVRDAIIAKYKAKVKDGVAISIETS